MTNKKGIELSINFIVIIVISLVVFFFGVRFIYNLASQTTQIQDITLSELDARIGNLICQGSEKVCLGIGRKVIGRGKLDIFEMKVINVIDTQDFDIVVTKAGGYADNGNALANNLIVFPATRTISLKRNEEQNLGIGIEVPKNAEAGTYIFDVDVVAAVLPTGVNEYTNRLKIYVEVS